MRRTGPLPGVLTGSAGGAFSGLTGVGGGAIMVPMLTGWLKLGQHRAHATSLSLITVIAAAGVIPYWLAGNVDWPLVAALVPGAVAGVFAGAKAMVRVPATQLRLAFGIFLLFVAFRQLIWHIAAGTPQSGATAIAIEGAVGFAGGMLAGMLGVGGGAIFVPAILIFGLADVSAGADPQKVAQGVSLVVIVFTALFGTITNVRQQLIDVETARWLAPAALVAAFSASLLANRLDADLLKRIYGLAALALGLQTIYSSARGMRAARRLAPVEMDTEAA
jgi:uncharacterized membrane protein YfcA